MRLSRARIVLLLSAAALGVWATAAPQAQIPVTQIPVPRIVTPRITAPRAPVIGMPDATVEAPQQRVMRSCAARGD